MSLALLFPGQGSQHAGMGRFLFDEFSAAKLVFEEASDAIGVNMKKLCFEGDDATLALTENTQPALLTVSVATYRVLTSLHEMKVIASAGHSVGEYAALVTSDVMTLKDGVRLVRQRGKYMQESVPVGAGGMVAVIGLTPIEVQTLCKWAETETGLKPLEPANYNSPDQIVISGDARIIEWLRMNFTAEKLGWTKKVRLIPLKVSAPFHCSMMKPAEEKMGEELRAVKFANARRPIVQNFTSQSHSAAEELRRNITAQISGAVRWLQSVELLLQMGSNNFIECGCGKVLTGLLKKIDTAVDTQPAQAFNINSLEELKTIERLGDL